MLTYTLEKGRGKSLYASLYEHIRKDISTGALPAGTRLPSKRTLAANLGVSIVTVESAYAQLIAEGYAEARERSGVYVCQIGTPTVLSNEQAAVTAQEQTQQMLFDLSSGGGEDTPFPFSVWAKTMRAVISEQGKNILKPVDFRGAWELRQAIAGHLYQSRGLRVSPEQIVIGAGNEYLYGLLVQLLGRKGCYAVEDPGYRKISGIYSANDVDICHIPLDREGMSVQALNESGANIAHISPAHHFPTGIVMPIRRRNALLEWAYAKPDRYIIEDDYDSELRHSGKPVPPLFSLDAHERVLYLSTFSQTIAPSLRIGYVCLPKQLLTRLRERLGFYTCAVPTFEQYTLAKFISSGDYERHINRLRKRYRDKRALILTQIEQSPLNGRCTVMEENAGTHFLLHLNTDCSDAELKRRAALRGLSVRFLSDYRMREMDTGSLIFNYACIDTEKVPEALRILAQLIQTDSTSS